jgi:hypothetical protein
MGQCPEKSVCFFNGIDFFCCPNEDGWKNINKFELEYSLSQSDPYDQHVFGGYDGEESKVGFNWHRLETFQSTISVAMPFFCL